MLQTTKALDVELKNSDGLRDAPEKKMQLYFGYFP